MREQKIRLAMRVEDAERHLNALNVKARLQGETLIGLGCQLRENPANIYRDGQSALHNHPIEKLCHIDDSIIRALELKGIVEIANEVRKETLILSQLRSDLELLK
jgi:hypothetical protein